MAEIRKNSETRNPNSIHRPANPQFREFGFRISFGLRISIYLRARLPDNACTMPKKEIRHPDKEKSTGAYSAAVEIDGWVYVSGIGPVDPKTAQPVRGSVEEETLYTLTQMKRILEAAGCTLNDVVKCTVHLEDIDEFDRYNAVYREFFKNVAVLPARTTVQSVLWNQIKVEIDCVAKKP